MAISIVWNHRWCRFRKARAQSSMGSAAIVVCCEFPNDALEMSIIHRNQIVQTLAASRPDYPLTICICHWTSKRSFQDLQTKPIEGLVDRGRENTVAVVDQITMAGFAIEERPELLLSPLCIRMICNVHMQNAT
jgi:hypothetical protein